MTKSIDKIFCGFIAVLLASMIAACNQTGAELIVPVGQSSTTNNSMTDDVDEEFEVDDEDEENSSSDDDDDENKSPESAFPGSRVVDISEETDFDDEDFRDEDEERTENSDCRFFTSDSSLALTEKPANFSNTDTVITHFPPAEYPMPVQETFQGEWQGDSYKFIAMVDIKISYSAHDPYETKWKTALPESAEDSLYERRYYNVTIANAESSDCTVSYTKDEG